jgi:cysteinyl-tRNA synthetase
MSKSLNNFFTVRDIAQHFDLEVLRMFMLSSHYRSPINFSDDLLEQTKNGLERLYNAKNNMLYLLESAVEKEASQEEQELIKRLGEHKNKFIEAMDDDINTADALAAIYDLVRDVNGSLKTEASKATVQASLDMLMELSGVLGLLGKKEESLDAEIEALIEERQKARKEKNWALSDKIRDDLKAQGIVLEDTPSGVKWKRV